MVDSATRQVRIYVDIPNPTSTLVAGLFAEGRVAMDTKRAVAVPVTAVDSRGTTPVVHLLKGGRVQEAPVKLGVRDEVAGDGRRCLPVSPPATRCCSAPPRASPRAAGVRVLQEEAGR